MSDHFAALHAAVDRLDCQMLAITFRVEAQNKKIEACRILRLNRARALRLLRDGLPASVLDSCLASVLGELEGRLDSWTCELGDKTITRAERALLLINLGRGEC